MALPALIAGLALVLAGCKSTPKVDWNSRVGTYTYDQAVAELGPPDKSAKLSDDKTVAEWVIGQKPSSGVSIGTGIFGGHGGVSVGQTVGSGGGARVLRLVFDPDNRLASWTRN
jgi:hypothetical protein